MNKVEFIVLHCTASPDSGTHDWEAVRRFHKDVRGYSDIGYHYGVELVGAQYEVLRGRAPNVPGAHCRAQAMNNRSLGVCMVGGDPKTGFGPDYPLPDEQRDVTVQLCADLCIEYGLTAAAVRGHGELDPRKTCPGIGVDMNAFRADVTEAMERKTIGHGKPSLRSEIRAVSDDLERLNERLRRLSI